MVVAAIFTKLTAVKMNIVLLLVAAIFSLLARLSAGLDTKADHDLPHSGVGACNCLSDALLLYTADPSCRSYCSCESGTGTGNGTGTVLQCPVDTFFNAKSQSCENVSMLEHARNCQDSIEFANLNLQRRSNSGHSHQTLLGRTGSRREARAQINLSRTTFLLSVITREVFYQFFKYGTNSSFCSQGSKIFQYDAFAMAAQAYPRLGGVGSPVTRKREIAAFLAQIARETTGGWPTAPDGPAAWGLCFHEEIFCSEGGGGFGTEACRYCDNSSVLYPCAPGKSYKGRGPIQLSWNYNYGLIGQLMGLGDLLLLSPDLVAQNGIISFKTAMQFWMAPQPPKPSCHAVMVGRWRPKKEDEQLGRLPGFGMTTNIINGGLECGSGNTGNPTQADRVRYFEHFCRLLGVDPGTNLFCANMAPYT